MSRRRKSTADERLESAVRDIARSYYERAELSVERIGQGVMNYMFKVRAEAEDLCIVRIYPPGREKVAKYEPDLIERLHALGCLVPRITGYSTTATPGRPAHLVYRYIPGHSLQAHRHLMTRGQLETLARAIAENLELMASHRVSGYGGLITADSADDDTALEFCTRSLSRGIEAAKATGVLSAEVIDQLESLLGSLGERVVALDGALAWGDLALSNILVDEGGRLTGLIDFESCFALDRALSIGYFRAIAPDDELLRLLIEASRSLGCELDERRINLCAVLRAARMARFAHTALPSGVAQRPVSALLPGAMTALARLIET